MELPETYTELRELVLRYRNRLYEEAHAASQCLKAWQAEYGDDNPATVGYLSGKSAGFNEALHILDRELEGNP